MEQLASDERPIKSAIAEGKQSFEEYLEQQLRLEEQKLKQHTEQQVKERTPEAKPSHKRTFLKRREGLNRFINAKPQNIMEALENETKQALHSKQFGFKNGAKTTKQQLQRKTAPVSKENNYPEMLSMPRNKINQIIKTSNSHALSVTKVSVLGIHNGQNISQLSLKKQTRNKMHVFPQHLSTIETEQNNQLKMNQEGLSDKVSCDPLNKLTNTDSCWTSSGGTNFPTLNHLHTIIPQKCLDFSFELSFQKKLEQWDKEKEKENIELDEFEFLEQAAEDVSFSSNSSFVQKMLYKDQQNSACRRLSSTPIKSTDHKQTVELDIGAMNYRNKCEQGPVNQKHDTKQTDSIHSLSNAEIRDPLANSNIASQEKCNIKTVNINMDVLNRHDDSFSSSESELDTTVKNKDDNEQILAIIKNNEDNTKCQDHKEPFEMGIKISQSRSNDFSKPSENYSSDESNAVQSEVKKCATDQVGSMSSSITRAAFDDDTTWADLDDTGNLNEAFSSDQAAQFFAVPSVIDERKCSGSDREVKRKVASKKKGDSSAETCITDNECEPPTSELMVKLFPSLKPKKKPLSQEHGTPLPSTKQQPVDVVQSQVLRKKLVELETEIERFRAENAALTKLREEREKSLENLRKEIAEFEQQKKTELSNLEEYKKEELRKLQKERKVFEKYAAAARAVPDKKEREEIQTLKQELANLQEELKQKEMRWSATHNRLRNQIETLTKENTELRDEIRVIEKLRLEAWKKAEAAENSRKSESIPTQLKSVGCSSSPENAKENQNGTLPVLPSFWKNQVNPKNVSPFNGKRQGMRISGLNKEEDAFLTDINSFKYELSERKYKSKEINDKLRLVMDLRKTTAKPYLLDMNEDSERKQSNTGLSLPFGDLCNFEEPRTKFTEPSELDVQKADSRCNNPSSVSAENSGTLPKQISACTLIPEEIQEEMRHPDGKVEQVMKNGHRVIIFPNGTCKEISADGKTITVIFFNGDVKQIMPDQRVIYYYADAQTTHTTFTDGLEVLHFPNNQIEKHYPDGRKEITFPDQTIKNLYTDGREESIFPDGTIVHINIDGSKIIEFNNGQKELHTLQFKRREYPDGTIKTVYANGQQETKYPTGRVRVKDKDGNIIMDSRT
ncbi:centromere protein J [Protopterus annectens]|uniref:centromere protein J n=1 Tax=Protopterus annectens TaxID=7888 RepID=UPI001CFB74F7|nr:centromere protein J [Protopterus annectens]